MAGGRPAADAERRARRRARPRRPRRAEPVDRRRLAARLPRGRRPAARALEQQRPQGRAHGPVRRARRDAPRLGAARPARPRGEPRVVDLPGRVHGRWRCSTAATPSAWSAAGADRRRRPTRSPSCTTAPAPARAARLLDRTIDLEAPRSAVAGRGRARRRRRTSCTPRRRAARSCSRCSARSAPPPAPPSPTSPTPRRPGPSSAPTRPAQAGGGRAHHQGAAPRRLAGVPGDARRTDRRLLAAPPGVGPVTGRLQRIPRGPRSALGSALCAAATCASLFALTGLIVRGGWLVATWLHRAGRRRGRRSASAP